MTIRSAAILLSLVGLPACGIESEEPADPETATTGVGGTMATSTTSSSSAGGCDACDVPTGAALVEFLEAGEYLDFPAESAPHSSTGPHFGNVRTFVNPVLAESLATGAISHPVGAAAIKELYGGGSEVLGWSVWVKLDADSAGGDNLYWYELYDGTSYADGPGVSLCTGCHASGIDFYRGEVPLP